MGPAGRGIRRGRFWAALAASALVHVVGLSLWALLAPSTAVPGCILDEQRLQMVQLVTEQCICPDPSHPRDDCPTLVHRPVVSKPVATKPIRAEDRHEDRDAVEPGAAKRGAGGDVESAGGYRILTAKDGEGGPQIPSGGGGSGVGTGTGTGVGPGGQSGDPKGAQSSPPKERTATEPDKTAPPKVVQTADPTPTKPSGEKPGQLKPQQPTEDALRKYRGFVAAKLDANKLYPPLSQQRGEEGVVVLSFSIGLDGMPSQVRVGTSSGNRRLDKAARETVDRAAPYTPLPKGASEPIPVTVRLTFSLH